MPRLLQTSVGPLGAPGTTSGCHPLRASAKRRPPGGVVQAPVIACIKWRKLRQWQFYTALRTSYSKYNSTVRLRLRSMIAPTMYPYFAKQVSMLPYYLQLSRMQL